MTVFNQHFICFDIETTGLNPISHDILEIGAVQFSINEGVIDTFSTLVSYDGDIPGEVIKIHGITNGMVKDAPGLYPVLCDFLDYIGDAILIAHNANFDTSFIGYQLGKNDLPYPNNEIYDTLSLSKRVVPHLASYSLSNLKSHFKIHSDRSHRALDDAQATMELFIILMNKWTKGRDKNVQQLSFLDYYISFSEFTLKSFNNHVEQVKSINKAIAEKQKLSITYNDQQNHKTKRSVEPIAILMNNGYLYLEGFCHLRNEGRRFRLDRIKMLQIE